MASKESLKVGDHIRALRMHNKAVSLTGTIVSVHADEPIVEMNLDDNENWIETVHTDDVTVLEPKEEEEATEE
jgi:hypothetical protein